MNIEYHWLEKHTTQELYELETNFEDHIESQ